MKFHSLMAAALLCCSVDSHAGLIHQFHLDGSLEDSVGKGKLMALGGSFAGNAYAFGANQGLQLDAQLGAVYTIDMVFHFDDLARYGRIVDFKNLGVDEGFYSNDGIYKVFDVAGTGSGGKLVKSVDSRLTLTRDAEKMFKVYQNGELVLSLNDQTGITDFGKNVAHFFRDNVRGGGTSGEGKPGAVDYIRIYDTALSVDEVLALTPPVAEVTEPASYGLVGVGLALLGFTRRRRKS